jgi:hypothetical protein
MQGIGAIKARDNVAERHGWPSDLLSSRASRPWRSGFFGSELVNTDGCEMLLDGEASSGWLAVHEVARDLGVLCIMLDLVRRKFPLVTLRDGVGRNRTLRFPPAQNAQAGHVAERAFESKTKSGVSASIVFRPTVQRFVDAHGTEIR